MGLPSVGTSGFLIALGNYQTEQEQEDYLPYNHRRPLLEKMPEEATTNDRGNNGENQDSERPRPIHSSPSLVG